MQSIKTTILRNMMLLSVASVGLLFLFWMLSEFAAFQEDADHSRQVFEASQKEKLREDVTTVAEYINYTRNQTEKVLRKTVRNRVHEAHSLASHLHEIYSASKKPEEVQKLIKDALRQLRFNDGRGYYFIFNLDGIEQLFADRPEMEGRDMLSLQGAEGEYVVRDMITLVRAKEEGFYDYTWTRPNKEGNTYRKTAFVKLFSPYDWVIGTGEYVDDVRADLQQQVLERLVSLRFGREGYYFGSITGGEPLFTSGRITKGSGSILGLTDPNGVKVVEEYEKASKNPGGGFVRYSWAKLDSAEPSPKISFVIGIPEWHWVIGAGVYLDTIEEEIGRKRDLLFKRFLKKTVFSCVLLLFLLLAVFVWARRLAGNIRNGIDAFSRFCRKAASESVFIDPGMLKFQEFDTIAASTNSMLERQRRATEGLVESEERYRTLFENMVHGVFYQLADGTYTDVNQAALDIFGVSREEFLGRTSAHLALQIVGEDGLAIKSSDHPSVVALHTGRKVVNFIAGIFNKSHKKFVWVNINAIPQFKPGADKPHQVFVTLYDITRRIEDEKQRQQLESRLQQAQRLEAIGTLAGGIAHDFNNILGAILGYAEMARDDCPPESTVARDLGEILTAGNRAKDLVKQILAFSRQVGTERLVLHPAPIIKEAVKLLRPSLPSTIKITQAIDTNAGPVFADPTQLHQIVVNLCTNAFHAMEEKGGVLDISLRNVEVRQEDLRGEPHVDPGVFAQLLIRDSGQGIAPEVLERIFDPYFTTKEIGKGTGMGLAIVHGIVKSYNGFVSCASMLGRGTEIQVCLPVVAAGIVPVEETQELVPTGTGNILFVDDEKILGEMGENMLARLGYTVTASNDSLEAMTIFLDHPDTFDLVITDQTMPGMTGIDLAKRLLLLRPDLPIILCTGYSSLVTEEKARKAGIRAFAMKPLAKREIAVLIRSVLDDGKMFEYGTGG